MILGIDTSGGRCAMAVVGGDRPGDGAVRQMRRMERGHAEALFPLIEAVLAEAAAGYGAISRIGVCTGPGSFTGIRVGVAAARGLALGLGVPAVGISRFEALAAEAAPGRACVVQVPGPRGALYRQAFDAAGRPRSPPRLVAADAPPPENRVLIGPGGLMPEALPDPVVIARLAADSQAEARPSPLYIRDSGAAPPREAPPLILDA